MGWMVKINDFKVLNLNLSIKILNRKPDIPLNPRMDTNIQLGRIPNLIFDRKIDIKYKIAGYYPVFLCYMFVTSLRNILLSLRRIKFRQFLRRVVHGCAALNEKPFNLKTMLWSVSPCLAVSIRASVCIEGTR